MSIAQWSVASGGVKKSLTDWGIEQGKLKLQNLASDTFTFQITPSSINNFPTFNFNSTIALFQGAVCRFSGRIVQTPGMASAPADRQKYVAANPWWDLENIVYQASRKVPIDPSDDDSALTSVFTSDVMLFQSILGQRITAAAQISDVLSFAYSQGANILVGTVDAAITPPYENALDQVCSDVVRRAARWTPDSVSFFNYSSSIPTFNLLRRAFLSSVSLDLNAGNLVIASNDVTARYDIQPSGIKLYVQRVTKRADGTYWQHFDTYRAGSSIDGIRQIVNTIPITGDDLTATDDLSGLAGQFWSAAGFLHYSGTVEVFDPTGATFLSPGYKINLANGQPSWASMDALVQTLDLDIESGHQVATFGPPDHLGVQDFLALARHARAKPAGKNGKDGKDGRDTGRLGSNGVELPGFTQISVCDTTTGETASLNVRTN